METFLVDSGASLHITRSHKSLTILTKEKSRLKEKIGDTAKYAVKGFGTTSFQLKSGKPLKMNEVLYVPRLKKNLLSISSMDDKGYAVEFVDGQVLTWPKGLSLTQQNSLVIMMAISTR
jgi:hypothetical protein